MINYLLRYKFLTIFLFCFHKSNSTCFNNTKLSYTYFCGIQHRRKHFKNVFIHLRILQEEYPYYGKIKSIFNDPDSHLQWYFFRNYYLYIGHLSHDLDLVWRMGITGENVNVGIVGDGVETLHKDLRNNFDFIGSYNFVNKSSMLFSSGDGITIKAAGLISAVANNYICGVGAAPSSKFSVLQILTHKDSKTQPLLLSKAISYRYNIVQIYVLLINVGREINMNHFSRFTSLRMFEIKYRKGRKGLGNIFVMGSGNFRLFGSNCAFNGYVQMPEIFVFGSILWNLSLSVSSERCNSILAASLSAEPLEVTGKLYTTTNGDMCQNQADGNYAAASISAGILTLLISEFEFLTPRQILYLIILSSIQYDTSATRNAGGFFYSYSIGYGMLNALNLIELARNGDINYLAVEKICETDVFAFPKIVLPIVHMPFHIYTSGCLHADNCTTEVDQVFFIFTLVTSRRNCIKIFLTSPSGTKYIIISPRYNDLSQTGFHNWRLKLLGYFGENPLGVWKIDVFNDGCSARLLQARLIFHGTCLNPYYNIISHKRVVDHICHDGYNISSNFRQKICNPDTFEHDPTINHDHFSFSSKDYQNMEDLNWLR